MFKVASTGIGRFCAVLSLGGGRVIEILTVDRAVSTPYNIARFSETLVLEGNKLVDVSHAPEGAHVGHQKMLKKWSVGASKTDGQEDS